MIAGLGVVVGRRAEVESVVIFWWEFRFCLFRERR
jgi:hypothetical protein